MRKSFIIIGTTVLIIIIILVAVFMFISDSDNSNDVLRVKINAVGDTCVVNTLYNLSEDMPNATVTLYAYDANGNTIGAWSGGTTEDSYDANKTYKMTSIFLIDTDEKTHQPKHISSLSYQFTNDEKTYTTKHTVNEQYDIVSYDVNTTEIMEPIADAYGYSQNPEVIIARRNPDSTMKFNHTSFNIQPDRPYESNIEVGVSHAGETVNVSTLYSKDGINLNDGNDTTQVVDSNGYVKVVTPPPDYIVPDLCIVTVSEGLEGYTGICYLNKRGTQSVEVQ